MKCYRPMIGAAFGSKTPTFFLLHPNSEGAWQRHLSQKDAILHALWEERPLLNILETRKHTYPHSHKHVDMNGTLQIINELSNRQLEPKNLSARKDLRIYVLSFSIQVKKLRNKKVKQLMMNYNHSCHFKSIHYAPVTVYALYRAF